MNSKHSSLAFIIGVLLVLLLAIFPAGCSSTGGGSDKVGVVVTLLPQAEFVERVGGDKVDITVMVPPGASPHSYEPAPSQITALSNAAMYAKVGSGVEFELAWMENLLAQNPDILVADCSKGIDVIAMAEHEHEGEDHDEEAGHDHGGIDPHIWMSPVNAQIMVRNITDGLIEVDPANSTFYEQNHDDYLEELGQLDTDIRGGLEGVQNRTFMTYHASFGYFAAEYGLTQLPIEAEGKEPTASGLLELIDEARSLGIKVIFIEPQFNPQSAEVIANEIGGSVIAIDPLARDYLENLRAMADKFIETLSNQ